VGEPTAVPRSSTRERLVTAAVELVAEAGWGGATTRGVAERAGLNQALVHYHFGTMSALLREAAYRAMAATLEPAMLGLLDSGDPLGGLRGVVDAVGAIDPDSSEARTLIEATVQAIRDPELNASLSQMLALFRSTLRDRLTAAQAEGSIRAGFDPKGGAVVLAALLDGLVLHRLIDRDVDLEAAASALFALLGPPA